LVFILSNKEFTPKVEEVVDAIKKKRDERKKRFKEARSVAKAAAMRTGSASQAPAAVSVVPQVGDEVGVVQMSRRHLKRTRSAWISMKAAMNSMSMLFRLFWTAFTMPIHPQKNDAIAQFDDFVAELLAAPAAAEFDGIYEQGGSY